MTGDNNGIYSSRCWVDGKLQPATIFYRQGKIDSLQFTKVSGATDFGDDVIMPGAIDAHVHINEPGRTDWEGFDTGTMAAAAGGITTIVDMPLNATPVTTSVAAFREKLAASEGKLNVNCGFYGGLIPGNIHELKGLSDEGVLGIKSFLVHSGIDEFPNVSESDLREALPLLAGLDLTLLVHCELENIRSGSDIMPAGSYRAYLASRPKQWENDAIDLMLRLCEEYDAPVHIVHVSSGEAIPKIANAKAKALKITAETCPHYIFFNAEEIPDNDTLYKCAPPIRELSNNGSLKKALKDGILDFIATDHSPAPPDIKLINEGDLKKAWGGIAGLQFLIQAGWAALKDIMTLEEFIPLVTSKPASFLKIFDRKGKIALGHDADFVIWAPGEAHKVENSEIMHRHKATPYTGKKLYGNIKTTIVNGITVFSNNQIINKNAGKWILRQ